MQTSKQSDFLPQILIFPILSLSSLFPSTCNCPRNLISSAFFLFAMITLLSHKWRICIYPKSFEDSKTTFIGSVTFLWSKSCLPSAYKETCECQTLSDSLVFCYILFLLYGLSDLLKWNWEGTKLVQRKGDLGCLQLVVIQVMCTIPVLTGGYALYD